MDQREVERDRARLGALALDQDQPHWRSQINTNTLDVGSIDDCPLAQVYGEFYWSSLRLASKSDMGLDRMVFTVTHGFTIGRDTDIDELNNAWIEEVTGSGS
jgi:hypothetical protein